MNTMSANNKGGEKARNGEVVFSRRVLLLGLGGVGATATFNACTAPVDPNTASGVSPEVPAPSNSFQPTPEAPASTPETPSVVEPLREWHVPADTLQRLQECGDSELAQRKLFDGLVKKHIPEHIAQFNEGEMFLEGSAEKLFKAASDQLGFFFDLAIDPNTEPFNGEAIARKWADLVFVNSTAKNTFLDDIAHFKETLRGKRAENMRKLLGESRANNVEAVQMSEEAHWYHDKEAGQDFRGIHAVAVTKGGRVPGKPTSKAAVSVLVLSYDLIKDDKDLKRGVKIRGLYPYGPNLSAFFAPGQGVPIDEVYDDFLAG